MKLKTPSGDDIEVRRFRVRVTGTIEIGEDDFPPQDAELTGTWSGKAGGWGVTRDKDGLVLECKAKVSGGDVQSKPPPPGLFDDLKDLPETEEPDGGDGPAKPE